MDSYSQAVEDAARASKVQAVRLPQPLAASLRRQLLKRYGRSNDVLGTDELLPTITINSHEIWKELGLCLIDESCMIFPDDRERAIFKLAPISRIPNFLAECPGFEYFFSSSTGDSVVWKSRYNMICAAGRVARRMRRALREVSES